MLWGEKGREFECSHQTVGRVPSVTRLQFQLHYLLIVHDFARVDKAQTGVERFRATLGIW